MKFKVPKNTLDKAIKSVSKAVPSKGVQPILNNILLENKNGKLTLNATDLDFTIEATIPSQNEEEGSITISARKLEEVVSKLDEDEIYIQVDPESFKTNLICKKSHFDLVGVSADDFPKIDKPDVSSFVTIEKNTFSKIVNLVAFAASKYDTNNILGGVLFVIRRDAETNKQIFEMAATDGNRLSSYEYVLNGDNQVSNIEAVVPLKIVMDVQRILDSSVDDNIQISFLNKQVIFFTQDRFIVSRLVEGVYPKYKQLIPQNHDKMAQLDRKELLSCLERIAVMANEITNLVKLSFKDNKLTIESSNQDFGKADEEMMAEYMGETLDIFFNVKYLIEPLKNIDSQMIQVSMAGPVTAIVIKPISDESFIHLVMPIKHSS
ncbi:MAG: DNA polymerase III subunit beta [Candidatus Caenarcaniphilales bacterium]|jgi:DNA polymerase-3 subunit beta|nr:DNA polymerase III subunit beta [Candidatus Caenarcaniphilales bacterium]